MLAVSAQGLQEAKPKTEAVNLDRSKVCEAVHREGQLHAKVYPKPWQKLKPLRQLTSRETM